MGNSSGVAIAIIGLIIGAAGLGLGVYSYFTFQAQIEDLDAKIDDVEDIVDNIALRGMWYDEVLTDWKPSAIDTNETITGLSITFQIEDDEKAYFLFIARVHTFSQPGSNWMIFRFVLDGTILSFPTQAAGSYNQDDQGQYVPLSLQYSTDSLSSGPHTVTVVGESTKVNALMRGCSLMVQTYVS